MGSRHLRIRPLEPGDVGPCAGIVAAEPLWQRYGLTVGRARRIIAGAERGSHPFCVAVVRGKVAGFVWFHLTGTFAHSGYIRWIGVAPDAQGKGIGSALVKFAERRILRHGPNVFLLVSDFNRRGQRFYTQRGYRRVGALEDYVVPGVTEFIYRKSTGSINRAVQEKRRGRS